MISNRIASPRDASVAVRLTLLGALFLAAVFLPDVEVAVIGRNLLHASHPEFGRAGPRRVEIERSLYARARASF